MLLTEGDYETNHRVLSVLGHIAKNIDKPTLLQLAGEAQYFSAQLVECYLLQKAFHSHTADSVIQ